VVVYNLKEAFDGALDSNRFNVATSRAREGTLI